jgi:small membrane protein
MLLQIIITLFAIFAISRSYLRFKNNNESFWEFLLWVCIWISIVVVVLIPEITAFPAKIFGIERGIDAMIYLSIVFLFYSIYRVYSKIEKVEQDITKLTREITLNKKENNNK